MWGFQQCENKEYPITKWFHLHVATAHLMSDMSYTWSDSGHFKTFQPIITTPNGHSALICSASISARLSLFCVLEKLSGHLCLKLVLFGSMDNALYRGWGYLVILVLKWYLRTKQRNRMDTNSVSTCSFHLQSMAALHSATNGSQSVSCLCVWPLDRVKFQFLPYQI